MAGLVSTITTNGGMPLYRVKLSADKKGSSIGGKEVV
jgi:hypothetical protein